MLLKSLKKPCKIVLRLLNSLVPNLKAFFLGKVKHKLK